MLVSFLDSSHHFIPQLFFCQEFLCGVLGLNGFQRRGLDCEILCSWFFVALSSSILLFSYSSICSLSYSKSYTLAIIFRAYAIISSTPLALSSAFWRSFNKFWLEAHVLFKWVLCFEASNMTFAFQTRQPNEGCFFIDQSRVQKSQSMKVAFHMRAAFFQTQEVHSHFWNSLTVHL